MKLSAISTVIILAGFASAALAGKPLPNSQTQTMHPITVTQAAAECSRPGVAASHACGVLYGLIDSTFTPRELQMIIAWETTHPQYLFDKIYDLHDRYEAVLNGYVAARQADAAKIAVK